MGHRDEIYKKTRVGILSCCSIFLIAGCATSQPPQEMLTKTEAMIEQAIDVDARNYAPTELREAQKQLDYARSAIEDEEYEEAQRFLREAQVTAEYAAVRSRSIKSQQAADTIRQDIETLRQELGSS
jgi:hypothetical protein